MPYTSEELEAMIASGEDKTDIKKMEAIANEDIDDSDIPDDFWEDATVVFPSVKKPISFRVEEDLLAWYREEAKRHQVRGYQSLMHSVLSSYKREQENRGSNISNSQ